MRQKFTNKVDGIFTSFLLPNHIEDFKGGLGCFCGNLVAPFYINCMSGKYQEPTQSMLLTIQSSTQLFDGNKFCTDNNGSYYPKLFEKKN